MGLLFPIGAIDLSALQVWMVAKLHAIQRRTLNQSRFRFGNLMRWHDRFSAHIGTKLALHLDAANRCLRPEAVARLSLRDGEQKVD